MSLFLSACGVADGMVKVPPLFVQGQLIDNNDKPLSNQKLNLSTPVSKLLEVPEEDLAKMGLTPYYEGRDFLRATVLTDGNGFFSCQFPSYSQMFGGMVVFVLYFGSNKEDVLSNRELVLALEGMPANDKINFDGYKWELVKSDDSTLQVQSASRTFDDNHDLIQLALKVKNNSLK